MNWTPSCQDGVGDGGSSLVGSAVDSNEGSDHLTQVQKKWHSIFSGKGWPPRKPSS